MTATRDGLRFGVDSMVAPLRRVAMRRPHALADADPTRWHYAGPIDGAAAHREFDALADVVAGAGAEIVTLADVDDGMADSVFTYDASFVTPAGAIILRAGKSLRRDEADLHRALYADLGIPVIGTIEAPGTVEGGDCFWLDTATLAVGRGFRTNQAGIDQLAEIVRPHGITTLDYDLPYHRGPGACLHLMSLVSVLADDLALVHAPLLPAALHGEMRASGYRLLHAPPEEFAASNGLSLNVLALAPGQLVAVAGFPQTAALMRQAGCDVTCVPGDALCTPCEGGPTCLTRPILRQRG